MESLECHLSCWLTDRLSSDSTARLTRLDDRSLVALPDKSDKCIKLALGKMVEISTESRIIVLKRCYLI